MAVFATTFLPGQIQPLIDMNLSYFEILLHKFYWITRIQMISVTVLMVCLIRIPSMSFAAICKEISLRESASDSEINQLLTIWKKKYNRVRDLVAELNIFLGQPMIIVVFTAMISSINMTSVAINKIKKNEMLYLFEYIFGILTNTVCLTLLALISEQIPQQVS